MKKILGRYCVYEYRTLRVLTRPTDKIGTLKIIRKTPIFHRDGIFFRYEFPSVDWYRKKILLLSHLTYPSFLWGVFEQNVRVFEAREPSQDGTEDGFFLLAISRRSSME